MLIRLLIVICWFVCTQAQSTQDTSISVNLNLSKECFEKESLNQSYTEIAGVTGFFFSFKLTPQCVHQPLEVSVTSVNNETFSGFHTVSEDESVSDVLTFSCTMPTPIFTREGMVSTIFLNTRGEIELPSVNRQVNLYFATTNPQYCQNE